jgi:hypothetical protein
MAVHAHGCDCGSYGCELRNKGVQVNPAGMVRHNRKAGAKKELGNNWEKGRAPPEDRPGGFKMPRLNATGDTIPIKQWTEGKFDKAQKDLERSRALNTERT